MAARTAATARTRISHCPPLPEALGIPPIRRAITCIPLHRTDRGALTHGLSPDRVAVGTERRGRRRQMELGQRRVCVVVDRGQQELRDRTRHAAWHDDGRRALRAACCGAGQRSEDIEDTVGTPWVGRPDGPPRTAASSTDDPPGHAGQEHQRGEDADEDRCRAVCGGAAPLSGWPVGASGGSAGAAQEVGGVACRTEADSRKATSMTWVGLTRAVLEGAADEAAWTAAT